MDLKDVYRLDSKVEADENQYGKKISVLTTLANAGLNVPEGYFFNVINTSIKNITGKSVDKLNDIYCNLNPNNDIGLIARSSISVEDRKNSQFPGVFDSIKNINSIEGLKDGVISCVESKESEYALYYKDSLLDISLKNAKVAVLIQKQIQLKYFGLAELPTKTGEITIEITDKEGSNLVGGNILPSAIKIYPEGNYAELGNAERINFNDLNINEVKHQLFRIRDILRYDTIVEFGIDDQGTFHVFQAREHEITGVNPLRTHHLNVERYPLGNQKNIILPMELKWGLKGAAMEYFKTNRLFEEDLLLIESEKTLTYIKKAFNNAKFCEGEITLRFSKGDEIGLKRVFASDRNSAFKELHKYYPDFKKLKQLLIVHPYLKVRNSYELLIDKDYFVLEHIPGLWEANNVLEPDVIFFDKSKLEAEMLIVKAPRQQITSTPYSTDRSFVLPPDFDFFEKRLKKFIDFDDKLNLDFERHLPLNFHFIETLDNKIAFLNIRRLNIRREHFENRRYARDGSFFHVRNNEDLQGWDGKSPILLRLTSERGKEKQFISLAQNLPKNVEVYINFGWLSHPAMILREFGVTVAPAYLDRKIKTLKYENN